MGVFELSLRLLPRLGLSFGRRRPQRDPPFKILLHIIIISWSRLITVAILDFAVIGAKPFSVGVDSFDVFQPLPHPYYASAFSSVL